MSPDQLTDLYPRLFHMATAGSWPAIRDHGLLTTEQLVDSAGLSHADRLVLLGERRAQSSTIDHPEFGELVIRDQAPLRMQFLEACLVGMSVQEWLEVLNNRVFFWLHPDKLEGLLGARLYRDKPQDVIVVNTESLVEAYFDQIRLSPINSGATLYPNASQRGPETFTTIEDYPYTEIRRRKPVRDAITELAVVGGVPDIAAHIERVERRSGSVVLEVLA